MKYVIACLAATAVAATAVAAPAFAAVSVPEMDGAVLMQFAALAGGMALLLKRKSKK